MTRPLYENYLTFLAEGGGRLASVAPDVSHRLLGGAADPDAERLLEGIAFLAHQVEGRFEARASVLLWATFDLYFPHYLRPIPSATILQIEGPAGTQLPRGAMVESIEIDGTPSRFATTYPVNVNALRLTQVNWRSRALTMRFAGADLETDDTVRFFVDTAERTTSDQLFESLMTAVEKIELLDEQGESLGVGHELTLHPVGLTSEESLWPVQEDHRRFQLIQEYFTQPEKFLFFDIRGLRAAAERLKAPADLGIRVHFIAPAPRTMELTKNELRLNCTPASNLFPHDAVPRALKRTDIEVLLRPEGPLGHYELFEVKRIETVGSGHRVPYPQACELNTSSSLERIAQLYTKDGRTKLLLLDRDPTSLPAHRTLSVDLLCTNGALPMRLKEGHIRYLLDGPPGLDVRNITRPSRPATPPEGPKLRRALILHLALARGYLDNVDSLRGLFELYSFRALWDRDKARELAALKAAIRKVQNEPAKTAYEGDSIRGQRTIITLDGSAFREGGLYVLGSLLNELIAMDAPINTFSELRLQEESQNRSYEWPARLCRETI